ncbi:MAG: septum formation initiator family protein [Muribaculaceae bacterium]|nr:septum formation initiator family protein [Muribaculaceae bacterium]
MAKNKLTRPKWIPRWLNLPFFIFLAFILLLLFFGDNNYLKIWDLNKEKAQLNAHIKAQKDSTAMFLHKIDELNTDRESLERIAREQYGMKQENEEVYITDIQ